MIDDCKIGVSVITSNEYKGLIETKKDLKNDNYYDVELDDENEIIPKGAKGKLLERRSIFPYIDWDKKYACTFEKKVYGILYKNVFPVAINKLKSIKNEYQHLGEYFKELDKAEKRLEEEEIYKKNNENRELREKISKAIDFIQEHKTQKIGFELHLNTPEVCDLLEILVTGGINEK